MRTKLVSLEEKHFKWIEKKCLNFSAWVRMKLDEEMKNEH